MGAWVASTVSEITWLDWARRAGAASAMSIVKANVERRNIRGIVFSPVFGGLEWPADRGSRASIAQRFGGSTQSILLEDSRLNSQFFKNDDATDMRFWPPGRSI